jgi:hypothetical protein
MHAPRARAAVVELRGVSRLQPAACCHVRASPAGGKARLSTDLGHAVRHRYATLRIIAWYYLEYSS